MTTEQQSAQPAPAPAPAEAAPGGKPSNTMDNNPKVDAGKIAKAAAAVAARQAERGEVDDDAPAPAPEAAPEAAPEPAPEPSESERPPLSKTDYWAHLDELQAELRQAQAQAKRGLPENLDEVPLPERLQMVGLDLRDPQMLDSVLDALAATSPESLPEPSPGQSLQLPEGADPALVQLLQQQQATIQQLQQRQEQIEQGNRTAQEQLQHERRQAALRAEEGKFAQALQSAPGRWPVAEKAIQKGIIPLGFANEVAESMQRRTGQPPTYGQVLQGIDTYLREEAEKTASLLGEVNTAAPQAAPADAPQAAPAEEPSTLAPAEAEASDRPLTRAERVKRAAALIKERQRQRKPL